MNGPDWKRKPIYDSINEIKDYNSIRKLVYLTGFSKIPSESDGTNYYINDPTESEYNNDHKDVHQNKDKQQINFDFDKKIKSLKNIYNNFSFLILA